MKLLVFDTCFNKSHIVLRENEKIISCKIINSNEHNYHSAYLIPEIRNILRDNKIFIKDLDAIGVNIGPGSFTGIRAGITIARVLAQQSNIELIGVSSLQILAKSNTTSKNSLILLDARKNKVYLGLYDYHNNEIIKPMLTEKENIKNYINDDVFIITDKQTNQYLKENNIKAEEYENFEDKIGLYLSEITYNLLNSKDDYYHWAKVKPLYIQQPSITKPKEQNNV